jgi:ABC-type sugar transport system ATPase subunit
MQAKKRSKPEDIKLQQKIKSLFAKKEEKALYEEEKLVCQRMYDQVNSALSGAHPLLACIRPEKVNLRLYKEGESIAQNETVVTASLCELLGAEYYVHIDFAGHEIVAHYPTGTKIKTGDRFVMTFDAESIMLFDPITGGRMV